MGFFVMRGLSKWEQQTSNSVNGIKGDSSGLYWDLGDSWRVCCLNLQGWVQRGNDATLWKWCTGDDKCHVLQLEIIQPNITDLGAWPTSCRSSNCTVLCDAKYSCSLQVSSSLVKMLHVFVWLWSSLPLWAGIQALVVPMENCCVCRELHRVWGPQMPREYKKVLNIRMVGQRWTDLDC